MSLLNLSEIHFLHIDDFANYRSMLKSILKSIGIQHIDDAGDARTALDKIEENYYDVVLCDYNLGEGQNGQQLLEEAMHRDLLPYGTIFIMVTAENTMDMVMAAVEYRPDGYLSKPFPKEILVSRLEKSIEKKEAFKKIYEIYNSHQYDDAIFLCDRHMIKYPKFALDIGKLKGEIALKAGRLEVAEGIYEKALSVRSFNWALFGKAKTQFASEKYEECIETIELLLEENPSYVEGHDLLSQVYEKQGELTEAQRVLQEAAKISPLGIARQQHLAEVAVKNDDFEVAEKSFRSSISRGKYSYLGSVADHTGLSKLYVDNGKASKAVPIITDAKKIYRKDKESFFHAQVVDGIIQQKLGNEEKARDIFQKTLRDMPGSIKDMPPKLQEDLLLSSELLDEPEITEALQSDINNIDGSSESAADTSIKYRYLLINGKGMRLYKTNKLHESIDCFEDAASNLTDNISVNMNAAQAYLKMIERQGKGAADYKLLVDKARTYLDVSKQIDPKNEKYLKLEELFNEL